MTAAPAPPPTDREALLHVFQKVQNQFDTVRANILLHEADLKLALDGVSQAGARDPFLGSSLPLDNPFRQAATENYAAIRNTVQDWVANVRAYERNTAFRERFGDSLLMFVYGKVKSGKSSMGNYLAYGHSNPSPAQIGAAQPSPHFFVEADTGKSEAMTADRMQSQQKFSVGVVETTSSIQGFQLPGLTWIDSPGLHSTTAENGRLAADYANCADLIVFLSHSSSPGRHSEFEEIAKLLGQGKPVVILITASDMMDTDEDEHGNVTQRLIMKSKADRLDQANYVKQELAKLPTALQQQLLDLSVFSLSVAFAQANTDQAGWQESGLAAFATRIAEIANDQGLAMKRQAPLQNLKCFCQDLTHSINTLEHRLHEIESALLEARADLKHEAEYILIRLKISLPQRFEALVDQHLMDDKAFAKACRHEVQQTLHQSVQDLSTKLGQQLDHIFSKTQAVLPIHKGLPGFQKHTETRTFKTNFAEKTGKASGSGLMGIVGGALGAPLGPLGIMIGAGLGGWLGNWAGGKIGKQFDEEKVFEIEVGDNRHEVALAARQHMLDYAQRQLLHLCAELDKQCYGDMMEWLQNIRSAVAQYRRVTERQLHEINIQLATPNLAH